MSTLLSLLLLIGVAMAFVRPPGAVEGFTKFGYSPRLLPILGSVELVCIILFLLPRTAVLGAILLTGYFGGAVATHVRMNDPAFVVAVVVGALVWVALLLREPRLRAILPLRK